MSFALPNKGTISMLDLIYIAVAFLTFVLCWALTKACEKL
jgi:hypothetical protein